MFDFGERLRFFQQNGYVIFRSALEIPLLDAFWAEVEYNLINNPNLTMAKHGKIFKNAEVGGNLIDGAVLRIIDIEKHSEIAPKVMLHDVVQSFLFLYYQQYPTAIQTLTYKYSSQQGAHSDLYLVRPGSVGRNYDRSPLAAAWFACEDSNEDNGALIIYPGSHLLPKKTIFDFEKDYGAYVSYLEKLCSDAGLVAKPFIAQKGDLLLWHGDFVHAGGRIKVPDRTRKSFVVHYSKLNGDNSPTDQSLQRYSHGNSWYYK